MQQPQIDRCHATATKYLKEKNDKKKMHLRNRLYDELHPFLIKWIKAILSKRSVYLTEEEIISYSWDCYQYCLKHYKPHKDINIPSHFYQYTQFFLQVRMRRKAIVDKREEDTLRDCEPIIPITTDTAILSHLLLDIKDFAKSLEPKYQRLFENMVISVVDPSNHIELELKDSGLKHAQYHEAKKLFRTIIKFFLMRK